MPVRYQDTPLPGLPGAPGGQLSDAYAYLNGATGYVVNPSQQLPGVTGLGFGEPLILMGYTNQVTPTGRPIIPEAGQPRVGKVTKAPDLMTYDQAVADIYSWDDRKFAGFANSLVNAGRIPPAYTRDQVIAQWQDLVNRARTTSATGNPMSPWDVLAFLGRGPAGANPYEPKTTTHRQYNITSPEEARAVLADILAQRLGKRPSESQVDDFQAALNSAQRSQPSITQTTSSAGGETISSTTSGGVSPTAFAETWAERELGSAIDDYQKGGLIANAFLSAIESPV